MKLMTLNIQGFDDWDARKDAIVGYIQNQEPEVIFFQEVVYLPEISPFTPVELLNETLSYPYQLNVISRLQVGVHYPVYREGMSILSRHPIVKSDVIALKKEARDEHTRILQMADLLVDGQIIKIANIHLSITDYFDLATPQLQEVLEMLRSRNEARIIMGDFNMAFLEQTAHLWQDDYIASTEVPYMTYPLMKKRVDYALVPKTYHFDSIKVSGDSLSDHRAVTIQITPNDD